MNLEILVVEELENELQKKGIWNLLCQCDSEFFPPLSYRLSTTQSELKNELKSETPLAYYNQMIKQSFLLALQEEQLVGFLSFIHNYTNNNILYNNQVVQSDLNNFITTILVDYGSRKHGIAQQLYNTFETSLPEWLQTRFVSTRTWSGNISNIRLLKKRGYAICKRIDSDRKFVNMTNDTLFFIKEIQQQ